MLRMNVNADLVLPGDLLRHAETKSYKTVNEVELHFHPNHTVIKLEGGDTVVAWRTEHVDILRDIN